jgi:hypothetical protein
MSSISMRFSCLMPDVACGPHSTHGFFPARIAFSQVAYRTRFFFAILVADLQ